MINENVRFKNITINLYSHDCSDNFMVLEETPVKDTYINHGYIWYLVSEYGASRVAHDNGQIVFIDPSGGPMIEVGTLLNQYSDISNILNEYHKVKKIWFDTITGRPMIETEKP